MTTVWPNDAAAMLSAIYKWATDNLGESGTLEDFMAAPYNIIWGHQDGPYPGHPFAVLSIVQPPAMEGGQPERSLYVDDEDEENPLYYQRIEYDAHMFFRIELFSRAALDSNSGLDETILLGNALEASLRSRPQQEAFQTVGLALVSTRPPLSIPQIQGFGFERRMQLDMEFRVRVRFDTTAPLVDSPDITGTVDQDGAVVGQVGGSD